MRRLRLDINERRKRVTAVALELAERYSYTAITRNQVADVAGISGPHIHYLYADMDGLRNAVLQAAISTECLAVIAQGLYAQDPLTRDLPPELRQRAVERLLTMV